MQGPWVTVPTSHFTVPGGRQIRVSRLKEGSGQVGLSPTQPHGESVRGHRRARRKQGPLEIKQGSPGHVLIGSKEPGAAKEVSVAVPMARRNVRGCSTKAMAGARSQSPSTSRPFGTFQNNMAVGQNQWYHSWVGAPPILVYLSGDWDVHRGYPSPNQ